MQQCELQLQSAATGTISSFRCSWNLNEPLRVTSSVRTIDLFVTVDVTSNTLRKVTLDTESPASTFLSNAVQILDHEECILIKLVVPVVAGYVVRSDILEFRMFGCPLVRQTSGFIQPRQLVQAFETNDTHSSSSKFLLSALETAVGAVLAQPVSPLRDNDAEQLEIEMRDRLSLDWFSQEPVPYKRVAYIKPPYDRLSFAALKAMGIGLVILDEPGSWLEDDQGPDAHLRELFITFNTNPDSNFSARLKAIAVQTSVDGIFSRPEPYLPHIAQVCQELGLPTSPPEAVRRGTDKYLQRQLHNDDGSAFRVSGVEDLRRHLDSSSRLPDFPIVVKPCTGIASQCVAKVSNVEELIQAVARIQERVIGYEGTKPIVTDSLIEPYVNGPEIDANLVMWDGELLFCEISDDFPSSADKEDSTMSDDFQETLFVFPSKLPPREQDAIRTSLHESVLRLGLSSGIFHVEARVRNSSMHYVTDANGITDLVPLSHAPSEPPSVFLLEVNIRPPAYLGLMTAAYTYGVDYFALFALRAIGDATRFKILSQPFLRGPQHTSSLIIISPDRGGILASGDPGVELKVRRPDLMERIPLYREVYAKGDIIPPPDGPMMAYISCVMVISRKGREDLLQTVQEVRREWKHDIR